MGKKSGNKLPDRWLDYKPVGIPIKQTRFIAFKVPLNERLNEAVTDGLQLSISRLLKSVPNLGMVIDLTNTFRYYTAEDIQKHDVEYVKIKVEGHVVPNQDRYNVFDEVVTRFLLDNADNNKLIGVHCTHGVNRTGYMICRYMIERLDFSANGALLAFKLGRGHAIERHNYVTDLSNCYKQKPLVEKVVIKTVDNSRKNHWEGKRNRSDQYRNQEDWSKVVKSKKEQHNRKTRYTDGEAPVINWRDEPRLANARQTKYRPERYKNYTTNDFTDRNHYNRGKHTRYNDTMRQHDRSRDSSSSRYSRDNRSENYGNQWRTNRDSNESTITSSDYSRQNKTKSFNNVSIGYDSYKHHSNKIQYRSTPDHQVNHRSDKYTSNNHSFGSTSSNSHRVTVPEINWRNRDESIKMKRQEPFNYYTGSKGIRRDESERPSRTYKPHSQQYESVNIRNLPTKSTLRERLGK